MDKTTSLPFAIGDLVEVDEEKVESDTFLANMIGVPALVITMGLDWIKVVFIKTQWTLTIAPDMFKKVKREDRNSF